MIGSFRSRPLRRFWSKSDASGLRHDWVRRIERQLSLLDSALRPEDMDVVTFGFHRLTGDQAGRYAGATKLSIGGSPAWPDHLDTTTDIWLSSVRGDRYFTPATSTGVVEVDGFDQPEHP